MLNLTKCKAIVGALFLTIGSVSAQDIIVLNNNTADEIQAKVIEVSDSEVKYKKWAYQDGPTFTITTAKIFVIKYRNGDKQVFQNTATTAVTTPTPQKAEIAQPTSTSTPQLTQKQQKQISNTQVKPSSSNQSTTTITATTQENNQISKQTPIIATQRANKSKAKTKSTKDDNRGFDFYDSVGYVYGLDDWHAVELDFTPGYRFNTHFFIGGTIGCMYMIDDGTIIPIMATVRADAPINSKVSFFGDISLGGGFVVDGEGAGFIGKIGPGIKIGGFLAGIHYITTGEGSGGIGARIGFCF